jgi:hypothetical protein
MEEGHPCGMKFCGESVGPMAAQIPPGAGPQPSVPQCPTCKMDLYYSGLQAKVYGTYVGGMSDLVSAYVRTTNSWWQQQDYAVNLPSCTGGVCSELSFIYPPWDTISATLNWVHQVGGTNITYTETLPLE